ncbi:MAG: glycosyltransferase family 2 protein [Gammaproteobacteria bacterium]|nr:glycosyltransferase family 2 protein [Gammaproteobacteria bacterium]
MNPRPRVSIVIRCCNEERHIGRLLDGILAQTERDVEIIVVDSGSTDATLSVTQRYPVRVVSIAPESFSFGSSLNLGCGEAAGEFIVIASAHVYPLYRDWLAKLLAPFRDGRVGLVYGRQRGTETSKYSERQLFQAWFPGQSNYDQPHSFCNNANAAIRRSLWQRFPYNESVTGLEDLAFAKEIKATGWRIAYEAEAEVAHVHEETWTRVYNRYRREAIALKDIYEHEQFGARDFTRLLLGNVLSDLRHAWHDGVLPRNVGGILLFRLCQFLGTYRGFRQRGAVSSALKHKFYYPNAPAPGAAGGAGRDSHGLAIDYSRAGDKRNG